MKPSQARNLYEIFELDKAASPKEIDIAFRKQALLWHPDKHIDGYEDADAEFKILMNAYCILSDPVRKREYDKYHFKRNVFPNYGKYRDERLTKYRFRQRALINRMLKKNERSHRRYKTLAGIAFFAMIAAAVWSFSCWYGIDHSSGYEHAYSPFFIGIPLFFFNGAMICYVVAKKEITENRKRCRNLVIRLYSLVDDQ